MKIERIPRARGVKGIAQLVVRAREASADDQGSRRRTQRPGDDRHRAGQRAQIVDGFVAVPGSFGRSVTMMTMGTSASRGAM